MLDLKVKSKMRKALYAKPTIIIIGVLLVFISRSAWGMYQKSQDATEKTQKAEKALAGLQEKEVILTQDILSLSTDRGIEGEIRDRFMVAKEGEKVIIVADQLGTPIHTVTIVDEPPTMAKRVLSAIGFTF